MNQLLLKFHYFLMILGTFIMLNASAQAAGFEEYGSASYYSDTFHGKKTASGELYDKDDLTCAHSSLAFNTKVRITRMDNNKTVIARVNDRMPLIKGKVVDLSKKAAAAIDLINDGRAKVKIEVVEGTPSVSPSAEKPKTGGIEPTESTAVVPGTAVVATKPVAETKVIAEAAPPKAKTKSEDTKTKETTFIKEAKASKAEQEAAAKAAAKAAKDAEPPLVSAKRFQKNGSVQIELREVPKKSFLVQTNLLSSIDGAMLEIAKLQGIMPGKVVLTTEHAGELNATYKISVGSYGTRAEAEKAQTKVAKNGYSKAFIVEVD